MAIKTRTDKIRVLFLETHHKLKGGKIITSGVDYARLILPAKELMKDDRFKVEIRKDPFTEEEPNWNIITRDHEIIVTSYIDEAWGYVQMAMFSKKNNCKIIIDLDDNVFELTPDNPVYGSYHKGTEKLYILESILADADHVMTTNSVLRNKICYNAKRSFDKLKTNVIPNYINLEEYDYKKVPEKKKDKITILHAGSSTHWKDLKEGGFVGGLKRILKEYPETEFVTIGNWIPEWVTIAGKQYRQMQGRPDVYEFINELWPEMIAETDIVVVPLAYDNATICKSGIKYLEFSAGKVAGVYANIRQYKEYLDDHPERGFLAKTEDEWYESIKKLVEDKKLRMEMGENAYQYVKENQTIQKNNGKFAQWLTDIVE